MNEAPVCEAGAWPFALSILRRLLLSIDQSAIGIISRPMVYPRLGGSRVGVRGPCAPSRALAIDHAAVGIINGPLVYRPERRAAEVTTVRLGESRGRNERGKCRGGDEGFHLAHLHIGRASTADAAAEDVCLCTKVARRGLTALCCSLLSLAQNCGTGPTSPMRAVLADLLTSRTSSTITRRARPAAGPTPFACRSGSLPNPARRNKSQQAARRRRAWV